MDQFRLFIIRWSLRSGFKRILQELRYFVDDESYDQAVHSLNQGSARGFDSIVNRHVAMGNLGDGAYIEERRSKLLKDWKQLISELGGLDSANEQLGLLKPRFMFSSYDSPWIAKMRR